MWKASNFFVVIFLLVACAAQKREGEQYVPESSYNFNITYSSNEKAFIISFTSFANGEICLPKMHWADENGGHYFFEDKNIYFVDRDIRYHIKDMASGYCTPQKNSGCVYVLKKNDRISGKLRIEDFTVPSEVLLERGFNPQLHYPYTPRFCAK